MKVLLMFVLPFIWSARSISLAFASRDGGTTNKSGINLGENDYLAAATANYLEDVESLFNAETEKISPILGEYRSYAINRPDYCINFDLDELAIPCTPEQMIYLIKRGNIPRHYSERTEYNEISKRKKSDKNSFYLESNSVIINCYWNASSRSIF